MKHCLIGTLQGKTDLCNLEPKDIDIEDICRTLGNQCRFNGRGRRFFSVAQHSLIVMEILKNDCDSQEIILGGLCHDFAETFIGDINSVLKKKMPPWLKELETKIMLDISDKYECGDYDHFLVKCADRIALYHEANALGFDTSWWSFEEAVKEIEINAVVMDLVHNTHTPEGSGLALMKKYREMMTKEND
jgi:5'-deoxynucleotidase YfbR-like HD superfamily hydrolase